MTINGTLSSWTPQLPTPTPNPVATSAAITPFARSALTATDCAALAAALESVPGIQQARLDDREDGTTVAVLDYVDGGQGIVVVRDVDEFLSSDDEWTAVSTKTGAVVARFAVGGDGPTRRTGSRTWKRGWRHWMPEAPNLTT